MEQPSSDAAHALPPDERQARLSTLAVATEQFLQTATVGEFTARLRLLSTFEAHARAKVKLLTSFGPLPHVATAQSVAAEGAVQHWSLLCMMPLLDSTRATLYRSLQQTILQHLDVASGSPTRDAVLCELRHACDVRAFLRSTAMGSASGADWPRY